MMKYITLIYIPSNINRIFNNSFLINTLRQDVFELQKNYTRFENLHHENIFTMRFSSILPLAMSAVALAQVRLQSFQTFHRYNPYFQCSSPSSALFIMYDTNFFKKSEHHHHLIHIHRDNVFRHAQLNGGPRSYLRGGSLQLRELMPAMSVHVCGLYCPRSVLL